MKILERKDSIGVFDSGIGGLSVANAISRRLPHESLIYVADTSHAPYGPRTAKNIVLLSDTITKALLQAGAKMIVVACNTATSVAIDFLRNQHPEVPFVGLEPAVKPAANGKRVGVLATQLTLSSPRYQALRDRYLSYVSVVENPCKGLVPIIESEPSGSPLLRAKLKSILDPMIRDGVDTLVLGCTHYPLVVDDIEQIVGPQVNIIDPSGAAAKQVDRLVHEYGLAALSTSNTFTGNDFYSTGRVESLHRALGNLVYLKQSRRMLIPEVQLPFYKI